MYDRYWRLRVAGALVCIAAALAFAAWYVADVLPIDLRAGKLAFTGIMAAVDVVFLLLGIAVLHVLRAVPERQRSRLREEAMAGNQDAIPLARPLMSSTSGVGKADETFDVKLASAVFQCLKIFFLLAFLVGITWVFVAGELQRVDFSSLSGALLCPFGQEPYCAWTLARFTFLNLMIGTGYLFLVVSVLSETLGPISTVPLRVAVRTDGLVIYRMMRRARSVPWSDVRLIEVRRPSPQQGAGTGRVREFMYFTHTLQFGWGLADGGTASLSAARLTVEILARTGLRERTFDPVLFASTPANVRPRLGLSDRARGRYVTMLVLLATLLGFVAIIPTVPRKDLAMWSTYVTAIIVILLLYPLLWARAPRLTAREQGGVALVSAASLDDARFVIHPAVPYEMTVGTYRAFKLNQVAGAVLGLLMALGGAALLAIELTGMPRNKYGGPWLPFNWLATGILVGLVALGLATFIVAVRARDTIVLAELGGVRKRWLLGNVFIPWNRVERI